MGWNYQITDTKFINPYNFIPVGYNKKSIGRLPADEDKLTGVLTCSLYTKGPIAILDTEHKETIDEHSRYGFMKNVDEQYMIPASAIRGMIRSVHEIVTDSCFSTIKKESYITARSNSAYAPAVLIKEKDSDGKEVWKLHKATRYMLKSQDNHCPRGNHEVWGCYTYFVKSENDRKYIVDKQKNRIYTGERVWMKPLQDEGGENIIYKNSKGFPCGQVAEWVEKWSENSPKPDGAEKGYLVLGEAFGKKKHHESVFCIDKKQPKGWEKIEQSVIDTAIEGLKASHQVYNDAAINKQLRSGKWYGSLEIMERQGCIPVWYKWEGENLYFSLASIGRKTYQNTLSHLVGEKAACDSREQLCTTCSVFGMVGEDEALGSRIRFMDAVCENLSARTQTVTLRELSSPRPSYLPFYLKEKGRKQGTEGTAMGYDNPNNELRGRKFYWHFNPELKASVKANKLNATVEVLGGDTAEHFSFKVYFDGITIEELAALVYSLNFNENEKEGKLCHKIGHGKPLGLGSVKIVVDDIRQRIYTPEKEYKLNNITDSVFQKVSEWVDTVENDTSVQALKEMVKYDAVEEEVRYPCIIPPKGIDPNDKKNLNALASHKWFSKNYKMGTKVIEQKLPDILDEDRTLNAYKAIWVEDKKKRR